jgi:DNA-3-methyladenine glycosylase II
MQSLKKTLEELADGDKVLAGVLKQVKLKALRPQQNHFESLVVSIINQQLSTQAADTIERRFKDIFGGTMPQPKEILKKSDTALRKSGLSFSKIRYIKNIARAVEMGELNFKKLVKASDAEVIEVLTKIKGIGRWTAEMFLIFSLARPDIFSQGDLGLKNAIKKLYKLDPLLHKKKYLQLIESWKPHRSLVSRHLWASLNLK